MRYSPHIEACSARSNVLRPPDLPLSGALKARYTRDVLESTAVELITPNLLEAADYEAEGERGQDFENHLHC